MPRAGWGLLIRDTGDSVFRYNSGMATESGEIANSMRSPRGNFVAKMGRGLIPTKCAGRLTL